MLSLEILRRYNIDTAGIEDLVSMLVGGELIEQKLEALECEVPEWLPAKLRQIKREIALKRADAIEGKLAKAKVQLEGFKTPQERKTGLTSEIKRLEKMLAEV